MSFTKVNAAGIGTTQPLTLSGVNLSGVVTASGLYVTGVSTFTGNVSIAGTLTYEDVTNVDSVGLITARSGIQITGGSGLDLTGSLGIITATTYKVGAAVTISSGGVEVVGVTTTQTLKVGTAGTTLSTTALGDVTTLGKFGVGTASPTGKLHVVESFHLTNTSGNNAIIEVAGGGRTPGSASVFYGQDSSGVGYVWNRENQMLQFGTNNTERLRIDSSGRLLVGTTSAPTTPNGSLQFAVESPTTFTTSVFVSNANSVNGAYIALQHGRGGTADSDTIVQSGDDLGGIQFVGADGTTTRREAATIKGQVDGTPGSGDMPGRLVFYTTADGASSPTERMRIDSSGNVGIAEASPLTHRPGSGIPTLVLRGDSPSYTARSGAVVFVSQDGTTSKTQLYANTGFQINSQTATPITFHTDATEALRIDSSQRLLVGTSSSAGAGCNVQIREDGFGRHLELLRSYDSAATPARLWFSASRGSEGSPTIQQSGDAVGEIRFNSYDGVDYNSQVATITVRVDGTPGANDTPGRLVFSTTADGASSPTRAGQFDSNQRFTLFGSTGTNTGELKFANSSGTDYWRIATNQTTWYIFDQDASHYVYLGQNPTAWQFASDARLKENIVDIGYGIETVKQLQPRQFSFIGNSETVLGFVAQELQPIVPEAVSGVEQEFLDTDTPEERAQKTLGVAKDTLIPILVKALQEAVAKIETLEQRLSDAGIA